MTANSKFFRNGELIAPQEAARWTDADRLLYFKLAKFSHPLLKATIRSFREIAVPGSPTSIILLIGPPGVGKSTGGRFIVDQMFIDYADEIRRDPKFIPAIMFESPLASEKFSFGQWYEDGCRQLHHPLVDQVASTVVTGDYISILRSSSPSVGALRGAMIQQANSRGTQLALADEGAHILTGAKGSSLVGRVNALKSLSNFTEMKLGLIGSYDLYALSDINGQMARRVECVYFPRYRTGDAHKLSVRGEGGHDVMKTEKEIFFAFERKVVSYLPLVEPFDITPYQADLMEASLGLPGNYKDTVSRALSKMLLAKSAKMTSEFLERSIMTMKQRAKILTEILEGEDKIRDGIYGSGGFKDLRGAA